MYSVVLVHGNYGVQSVYQFVCDVSRSAYISGVCPAGVGDQEKVIPVGDITQAYCR